MEYAANLLTVLAPAKKNPAGSWSTIERCQGASSGGPPTPAAPVRRPA